MTFYIFTSGCKANQWDSHVIAGTLKQSGFTAGPLAGAHLVIVNACSLTKRAEADARRFIQRVRQLNTQARIVLVGCHAQAYPGRHFGADLVLGQGEKLDLERLWQEKGAFVEKRRDFPMEKALVEGLQKDRTRFFFKIQDGCNKFCSYCIVPYSRGSVRSRPLDDIVTTMRLLREKGIKEVVLTGIDMAAYRDPGSGIDLNALLQLLDRADTPPRIRLSSVDPDYLTDAFVETLARSKKMARSIHIPVQSGSDRILRQMGRKYTSAFVKQVVANLKREIGGVGVGMDIMVGFPGEDEDAFRETYRFIEETDISYLHVFPYSEREGTRACAMEQKVPEAIKRSRVRELRALDAQKRESFARRFVGRRMWVIPEGKLYRGVYMRGYADNYLPVYLPFEKRLENNLVEVTIKDMQGSMLIGEC